MTPTIIKIIRILRVLVRTLYEGEMYDKINALLIELENDCRRLEDDGK